MPTYEYQCKICMNVQEVFHSMMSTPEVSCEVCKGACEKIFTPTTNFICDGPSQNFRLKSQMLQKNARMKTKMIDRERSGEGATKMSDIK